ncbi:hypothetical protein [Streptomyces sp. SID13031]|uniref:hypothetical protein n=1 Tax=Streptomyces sp. SID13031 TaxID=2706046 RepID=UPI0013C768A8|nr:hypothetical protein [Streptomyces sp. SID13031]NEA37364.1 hypothetical protein [Streptomyces sp. SID13031]
MTVTALAAGAIALAGPSDHASTAKYCQTLKDIMQPPSSKPGEEAFTRVDALAAKLAADAPGPIRGAVQTYSTGLHQFVVDVGKVGFDSTKITPEQYKTLQTPEMTAATKAIMKSAQDDCDISTPSAEQSTQPNPSKSAAPKSPPASKTPKSSKSPVTVPSKSR